jgi:hypothetical protein
MNGNVSAAGVKLDLEWMHRVGIGGAQLFQIDLGTPLMVAHRLDYMSPEWQDALRISAETAQQLGLEFSIQTASGWSASGGPWVQPEDAMKKLVWSELRIEGRRRFRGLLPDPPHIAGPYQDVAADLAGPSRISAAGFYKDALVLAYRCPALESLAPLVPAETSASVGAASPDLLSDGKFADPIAIGLDPIDHSAWVQYTFDQPQAVRSVQLGLPGRRGFGSPAPPLAALEASTDGEHFRPVADLPPTQSPARSASFAAVTARYFRVRLWVPDAPGNPGPTGAPGAITFPFPSVPSHVDLSEFRLYRAARVNAAEEKAGFATLTDYYAAATRVDSTSAVAPTDVIDLTARLSRDGVLDWRPPTPGLWVVLRLGYSLTGRENGPAPPEATGLEVDKLDALRVRNYLSTYLEGYRRALLGNSSPAPFPSILSDSIESGPQNWTDDMVAQFRSLRGYDPTRWLPALTGVIVGSASESDRFLWDFRRTIAQLLARNHYGQIASLAHARGLTYSAEALEDHRPQLGDDMEMRAYADVPMGAMWLIPPGGAPAPTYVADLQGAASVAHVYGKPIVAAESLTAFGSPYAFAPADLKSTVDREFALGVNRIAIHESAHQPLLHAAPGVSLAPFLGQYFNRNETWAEQAGAWILYLARSSFLLQQGAPSASIAYFYGEEAPLTALFGDHAQTDVPPGYAFDFVGADAILHRLTAAGDGLEAAGATPYRVLYLGGSSDQMTLGVLRRIREFVHLGVTVVGERPSGSPSRSDDRQQFDRIATELWGAGAAGPSLRRIGRGTLVPSRDLGAALAALGIAPDWRVSTAEHPPRDLGDELAVTHRALPDGDLYFVSNPTQRQIAGRFGVRRDGKAPEFWRADTGTTESAPYEILDGWTDIPLDMNPGESLFIVLRKSTEQASREIPQPRRVELGSLSGAWRLTFEPGSGAPDGIDLPRLKSWSEFADPAIRFFSGVGTYTQTLTATKAWCNRRLYLDLGDVHEVASVLVNGEPLGTVWKRPYRIELTGKLHEGSNVLTVAVADLWVNRLVGDAQPGALRHTVTNGPTYRADAPLRPAGLVGPVTILGLD